MESGKNKQLDELVTNMKELSDKFNSADELEESLTPLKSVINSSINSLGDQKQKDYLNAMMSSNGHAADIMLSLSQNMNSSYRIQENIGNELHAIESLKRGITNRKDFILRLEKNNSETAIKSLIFEKRELEKDEAHLSRRLGELKKFELTYGYLKVKELEKEKEHSLKTKFVVLTEDGNPDILRVILDSSGFKMDIVQVFLYPGVNKKTYKNSLNLIRFLSPNSIVIVHRDRDLLSEEDLAKWHDDSRTFKHYLLIPEGYDIESYLINADHILELYPEMERQFIEDAIVGAMDDRKNASIGKMKNSNRFGDKEDCEKLYMSDPKKYSYTKLVLGALTSRLSDKYNLDVDLIKPSKYLNIDQLNSISKI